MGCFMATAEECRQALEDLTGRIAEMDPADRQAHLVDRLISCKVSDLGVTFVTRIGPDGAAPVTEANGTEAPAQVRFTAKSDDLIVIVAGGAGGKSMWCPTAGAQSLSVSKRIRLAP